MRLLATRARSALACAHLLPPAHPSRAAPCLAALREADRAPGAHRLLQEPDGHPAGVVRVSQLPRLLCSSSRVRVPAQACLPAGQRLGRGAGGPLAAARAHHHQAGVHSSIHLHLQPAASMAAAQGGRRRAAARGAGAAAGLAAGAGPDRAGAPAWGACCRRAAAACRSWRLAPESQPRSLLPSTSVAICGRKRPLCP